MNARIAVVGSLNMDLIVRTDHLPAAGETIIGHDLNTLPGGKGANQAVAAAHLGAKVSMIGRIGDDVFGERMLGNLSDAGVECSAVIKDNTEASGVALIAVDQSGANSIIVAPGANMILSSEDVKKARSRIAEAEALLLQHEIPEDAIVQAVKIAKEAGVKVVLNPAPARNLPTSLLSQVDVIVPNETEARMLTGIDVNSTEDLKLAGNVLLNRGVRAVVVTLGGNGSLLIEAGRVTHVPAFPVKAVDTVGAGDAFVAGFAVAMVEGRDLPEAALWGNAAGALATTRLGAQSSLPTRNEVEMLIAE